MDQRALAFGFTVVVVALLALSVGLSAASWAESADDPPGRRVFIESGCGACHQLRDARTAPTNNDAPNLDLVAPEAVEVERFVLAGGVGMPSFADLLTEDQIADLTEYVGDVAGR